MVSELQSDHLSVAQFSSRRRATQLRLHGANADTMAASLRS